MKKLLTSIVIASMAMAVSAQNEQIHIFRNDKTYSSFKAADVESIKYTSKTAGQYESMVITGVDGKETTISLSAIDSCLVHETGLPEVYVNLTDYPDITDLLKYGSYNKSTVYAATLSIAGNGQIDDLKEQTVEFSGRGNSTWSMPKTPYKFKMAKKVSVGGMKKAKSYALIANYIDCSLMRNAIALWLAQYLEMPFSNHCVPVKVYINGNYKGQYMMTEKIGIGGGSVDIDEYTGMLFELDSNYDEDFKFSFNLGNCQSVVNGVTGANYLPVMVKDPDLTEIVDSLGTTTSEYFTLWRNDMTSMLTAVMTTPTTGSLKDYIDLESAVNFFLVNGIANNHEMKHPKSFYIHKPSLEKGEVYRFGPVWDFDWAFTFDGVEGASASLPLVTSSGADCGGHTFLKKLFANQEFKALYKEKLDAFIEVGYPQLKAYIEQYRRQIAPSARENGLLWPDNAYKTWCIVTSSYNFDKNVDALLTWLDQRLNYMKSNANYGLY